MDVSFSDCLTSTLGVISSSSSSNRDSSNRDARNFLALHSFLVAKQKIIEEIKNKL
jgi:hypothetical protein